jgi:hypothetical protein
MTTAKCSAGNCSRGRNEGQAFCRRHWFQLPYTLRRQILDSYQNGGTALTRSLLSRAIKGLRRS